MPIASPQAPGGFIGGYLYRKAFDQSQRAGEAEIEGQNLSNETEGLKLQLARKAMLTQANVEKAISGIPGLAETATTDPAKAGAQIASTMIANGQPEAGADLLQKLSASNQASAAAAKSRTDAAAKRASYTGAAFEGVHDEASWKAATAALMYNFPEEQDSIQQLAMLPHQAMESKGYFDYTKVAQGIVSSSLTSVQKAQKEASEAAAHHSEASAEEARVRAKELIPAQTDAAKARAERDRKYGSIDTKAKQATTADAKNLILKEYEITPQEASLRALEIADRSMDLQKTQGLERSAALKQAFDEAKRDDVFAGLKPMKKVTGTREAPFSLPIVEDKIDEKKLRPNMFYQTNRGNLLWDGKVFRQAQEAPLAGEEEEEPDDTGEDEGEE